MEIKVIPEEKKKNNKRTQMQKYNASLVKRMQVPHMAPRADSPARSDATHGSGTPGWNLLWDMSLAPCARVASSHREESSASWQCGGADRTSGNQLLTVILVRVTAANGSWDSAFSKTPGTIKPFYPASSSALVVICDYYTGVWRSG